MKIKIKLKKGKWTVNGKPYKEMSDEEKDIFDGFIKHMKESKIINKDG